MKLTPCFDPLGTVKMRDTQNIGPDSWYATFPITLHQVMRIFKIRIRVEERANLRCHSVNVKIGGGTLGAHVKISYRRNF